MIYVDPLVNYPGKGYWSHMMTDGDIAELHTMALLIGLKREWFQDHPHHPHYDLRAGKRASAIAAGARPVSAVEMARRCSLLLRALLKNDETTGV